VTLKKSLSICAAEKMKICLAQIKAVAGDVDSNIDHHKKFADVAVFYGAGVIIFPELSLTGYEPALAKGLATGKDDERFNKLQQVSDSKKIIIGAGMPIKTAPGISIGMIIFQPYQARQAYFKQYIHPDEEPYFVKGKHQPVLSESKIAMAICYEISVPLHAEQAYKHKAETYIASVAKTAAGVEKAIETLSETAKRYSMTVLMSNCVGINDGVECAGRSSVWDNKGILLEQLNDKDEGLIIFDSKTQKIVKIQKEYSS
jgi:predicted amidohydrolase